jgi:squalene-associated FAD-dependent desaturase
MAKATDRRPFVAVSAAWSGVMTRVAIVGGGLAGLATALALSETSNEIHLFEARRQLGGRAASFRDPATGALVDFCQHVSMGCCTSLADFCRRTNIDRFFRRERVLNFIGPDGELTRFGTSRWLPAPFHLAPGLMRIPYLTLRERWQVARGLWHLIRSRDEATIGQWLIEHGQTQRTIERFWSVVLVSALGETIDRASLSAARKVFIDGFVANRTAYEVLIPERPLSELFHDEVGRFLKEQGVQVRTGVSVGQIAVAENKLWVQHEATEEFDAVIAAVSWRALPAMLGPSLRPALPWLDRLAEIESSPITGVHLWFDREITPLPHAVLVGRLSQWMFNRGSQRLDDGRLAYAYQVVISASRELAGQDRETVVERIVRELAEIWPAAREANLLSSKVVTEHHAVFSARPGVDALRPSQRTNVPGFFVAGDWTATGWPSTMEGAVRSGYLAARLASADPTSKTLHIQSPGSRTT